MGCNPAVKETLLTSPDYPNILGQLLRHEAIVRLENGGPYFHVCTHKENLLFPVFHSVHPGLFSANRSEEGSATILVVGGRKLASGF